MAEHTDAEVLIARAQNGDQRAFEELVESHQDRLRRFISSRTKLYLGPATDIEETLQETFVRAFESIDRFRWQSADSFFRWLCGVAKHVLMRTAENARKSEGLGDALAVLAPGVSPSKGLRRDERLERLQQSLDQLPAEYREVVCLARMEGLKIKEIAERMGRSPDSVKHLLARALIQMRTSFGDTESLHLPDRQLRTQEDDDGQR